MQKPVKAGATSLGFRRSSDAALCGLFPPSVSLNRMTGTNPHATGELTVKLVPSILVSSSLLAAMATTAMAQGSWKEKLQRAAQAIEEAQRKRREQAASSHPTATPQPNNDQHRSPTGNKADSSVSPRDFDPPAVPDQPSLPNEFRAEARITFRNGVQLELALFELLEGSATLVPSAAVAALPGSYADVLKYFQTDTYIAIEQEGAWTMVDGNQISSVRVTPHAHPGLAPADTDPLTLDITLRDGSGLRGRFPHGRSLSAASFRGIRRILGREMNHEFLIDRRLRELTCTTGACLHETFTSGDGNANPMRFEFERPRPFHGCCIAMARNRQPFGFGKILFESEAGEIEIDEYNVARLEFLGDFRHVRGNGLYEGFPTRLTLRTGESAVGGLGNYLIRGWTRNGRLIQTRLGDSKDQRAVHAIDFYVRRK